MAGPYDSVVSIGGQSFMDGLWRLFGPALEGLTNPLPIALPGFANAELRIAQLIPILLPTGPLEIIATVDVTAEALLDVVKVGNTPLNPLSAPRVVPVPVNLTPNNPLSVRAAIRLGAVGPAPATRFSLAFIVVDVVTAPVAGIDPSLAGITTDALEKAFGQIRGQLGLPFDPSNPKFTFDQSSVGNMLTELPNVVRSAVDEALSRLVAETGRLVFPIAGTGSSCDQIVLPTDADVSLTPGGTGVQIGFKRPGSTDIQAFPTFTPNDIADCKVIVGNTFLLRLLCCLVEKLSAFNFPFPAEHGSEDINGNQHVACCTFRFVNASFGPLVIGGGDKNGVSICIDGAAGEAKQIRLIGRFTQSVPTMIPLPLVSNILDIEVRFTIPLSFDLDDSAAITNLRPGGVTVYDEISVKPTLGFTLIILLVAAFLSFGFGLVGLIAAAIVGPVIALTVLLLVWFACDLIRMLLGHAAGSLLTAASLIKSPAAVPPGLFEAFGNLAPVSVTVDDLSAEGVLHTPTSPWGLLPRLGLPGRPRRGETKPKSSAVRKGSARRAKA